MATNIVDFQNCFIFILLPIFSILCLFVFFKKSHDSLDGDLPPSPPSLPIIGHLHLIFSLLPHKSFQKLSSKYGPLLRLRIFNVPVVLASSGSVAYEVFRTHDVNVSSHGIPPVKESLLFGSSGFISAPYGDYFKFMKKLAVTKLLGPHALERSRGVRAAELHRFYSNLFHKAMKKECVEIRMEAMKFTNNSICKMIMGRTLSEEDGEAERVRVLVTDSLSFFKKLILAVLLRKPLANFGISLFKKELMALSSRYDEFLERILAEHEEKQDYNHGTDMMDVLLEAYRDKNAEYKITKNHIKSFFVELIIGGTDTTVQSTQYTMAQILNNPNILERLREEIDSVVGKTRLIQENDIPNLPYLQAVVKEGLRLHPHSPLLVRTFLKGCKVGGYYLPKNTTVIVNAYAVMRDPNLWEDPDEFNPERFLTSLRSGQEEERDKTLKYLPFGSGRRGCLGIHLSYIFLGTAIGMMVQCFDWRINGDKVNVEEATGRLLLTMAQPLKCTPVARTQMLTTNS